MIIAHKNRQSRFHHGVIIAITTLIFFLDSCAAHSSAPKSKFINRYFPVINREDRTSSLGFSIAPPSGAGWYEKIRDNSLYYLKRLRSKTHTIYTKATELKFDPSPSLAGQEAFLRYVKSQKRLNLAGKNVRNVSTSYTPDSHYASNCVRYSQYYEEFGNGKLKRSEFVKVSSRGLMCQHPTIPDVGVDMFYVESDVEPRSNEKSYEDEGEVFLSSLKFSPRKGG